MSSRKVPEAKPDFGPLPDEYFEYCDDDEPYEEMSAEEIAGEECGRWNNGRLMQYCTKAGSEECDWECPYSR